MANSKQIVYLSQSQYTELIANGTITVNGVTVTYDENDIYVTPQAEPVTDVRVNGTSVASNGVANIPIATSNDAGVVKVSTNSSYGVVIGNDGVLRSGVSSETQIKTGTHANGVVSPAKQHIATFYGLAKAAGHDEKDSTESVGTYTPEAKAAIQQMLGVSDLIATAENNLVASKAYAVGDVFTANGKLYKATAAIAAGATIILQNEGEEISGHNAEEVKVSNEFVKKTDIASANTLGIIRVQTGDYGLSARPDGELRLYGAFGSDMKGGTLDRRALTPAVQHEATFYGLAKAAGDTTQSQSSNAVGTYTDEAKAAIRTMVGAVGNEDYATSSTGGVVKLGNGITASGGALVLANPSDNDYKTGGTNIKAVVPSQQHKAVFYGLAKASGDTTQSASSNAVGTYTDNAKASIKAMLGIQDGSTGTVDVSGTTPTIAAVENTRYVCGEVTSLTFTPPASGISIVRFTSGSTVTVLTIPSTVKFPEWFDPTSLETNTIYEICVTDGIYGAVMSWAL